MADDGTFDKTLIGRSPLKRGPSTQNGAHLLELPIDKFVNLICDEERVKVHVDPKGDGLITQTYSLPKATLCKGSEFFRGAFYSGFKEGQTGEVILVDTTNDALRKVIKFIFSNHVSFRSDVAKEDISNAITELLDFLTLADRLILHGDFNPYVDVLQCYIARNYQGLKAEHVQSGMSLAIYKVDELIIHACVQSFVYWFSYREMAAVKYPQWKFNFQQELKDIPEFAAGLIDEYSKDFARSIMSHGHSFERIWAMHNRVTDKVYVLPSSK